VTAPGSPAVLGRVFVDGQLVPSDEANVSVFDIGFQRGYACFEALRAYGGRPFRAEAHCARLTASAARLAIDLPPLDLLIDWIEDRARSGGECVVRIFATGGLEPANPGVGSRVIVYAEPIPPFGDTVRIGPVDAPWHADGHLSELSGTKTVSYGPNLAASLAAKQRGFDDALLIGRSGSVLEGPTYAVAWVAGGVIETPSLDLGILGSITREAMLDVAAELALPVVEGHFPLGRMLAADEAFVLSTLREILPVAAVGDRVWDVGATTRRVQAGSRSLVAREVGFE